MSKHYNKNKHFVVTQTTPDSRFPKTLIDDRELIHFSFKHFQSEHETCKKEAFHRHYPKELLIKLQAFEKWTTKQFRICINDQHYRIHPIQWDDPRVQYNGFGLNSEYDANAWQFSVSKHTHGRVCGFFIGNTFYVVWLDPHHKVYPS